MGLPTASLFATHGYQVLGVDINAQKVSAINKGKCPFDEPGLPELVKKTVKSGRLKATTQIQPADIFIIAVPTPLKNRHAELKYVKKAAEMIVKVLTTGNLVILESTVSPGTCQNLLKPIFDKTGKKYLLAHCPERAIPGNTMHEIIHNERIIGGLTRSAALKTKTIYQSFVKGKIFLTDVTTAETCKLMENTYRDVNIALANELTKLAQELKINVWEAIKLANLHPRVNIMRPGPGVGGHCLAVDPWFLTEKTKSAKLIPIARQINDSMPAHVVSQVAGKIKPPATIGILGVAYKKNVDDARETPALKIIELLKQKGYRVLAHDPYVKDFPHPLTELKNLLKKSRGIILVTDHDLFRKIPFKSHSNLKFIFDTRNIYVPKQLNSHQTLISL